MRAPLIVAVSLVVMGACKFEEPPVVATGRYVEYASDDFVPCPAVMDRLDRYVENVYADLGLEPPDGLVVHYNYLPDGIPEEICGDAGACACRPGFCGRGVKRSITTAFAPDPMRYHEIAHAIQNQAGLRTSLDFLDEGFAMRYSAQDAITRVLPPSSSYDVASALHAEPGDGYVDEYNFTQAMISTYGLESYVEFLQRSSETPDAAEQHYIDVTGDPIQQLVDDSIYFDYCMPAVAQCNATPFPQSEGAWQLHVSQTDLCSNDTIGYAGPASYESYWVSGRWREQRFTLDIAEAGEYRITHPHGVFISILSCETPCDPSYARYPLESREDELATVGELPTGLHEVVVLVDEELVEGDAAISIERNN